MILLAVLMPTTAWRARLLQAILGALSTTPAVRDWVLEMKFKPKPRFRRGFLVPDDLVFRAKASAFAIEMANPRHEHEWRIFEEVKLPDGATLIAGMLDVKANCIEHPDLVAQRLVRLARVVGRENVMATTDCGFGTFAGTSPVYPDVAYAKLASMAEGARLASRELW